MKVSIIIPNYNGEALLRKNVPSVFAAVLYFKKHTSSDAEVVIIDDASEDNSKSVLEELSQQAKKETIQFAYQLKEKNEGFSPTINQGVKKATGEFVLLLNSDVHPNEDFLLPLVTQFSDENVFAVGMMDKSIEQGKEVLRGRGIGAWERGFMVHAAGALNNKTTLWVNGGSGMFRKKMWEELGGMDELYKPFYWEDIDLSYRALKAGYSLVFEKQSSGVHEHEEGAIKKKYTTDDVQKIAYRNQFIFVWKNADETMLWFHFIWLPYHILKAILRKDTNFFAGLVKAARMFSAIIKKRKDVQKHFIISDYDIIARYKK